jgi:glyoxylase-like metal-dependent hydrolase (beta-lactamase superfamily II)
MCPRPAGLLGQRGLLAPARLAFHCLLVELREGLALIDTRLGTLDVADPRRRQGAGFLALASPALQQEETALAQVERMGLRAQDVRHVLPTHLDLDHAGGSSDFPEAQVHVLDRELEAANLV